MNDDRALRDLEQRCARTLHAAAPVPPPDFAARCLARTAVEPQRGGLGIGLLRMGPLVAAAAVVVLAVVVGLQLGNLIPDRGPGAVPTPAPTVSPSGEPSSPAASPSVDPTPSVAPSAEPPSSPPATFPGGEARCTNEMEGYAVSYPADWYTNETMDLDEFVEGPETGACTFFGRQPMELRANAGLPDTVIIRFSPSETRQPPSDGAETISEGDVVVAGRPATVRETEQTTDAGAPFSAPGDRWYDYTVELVDGSFLIVATSSRADGDYEENKAVLDAMMSTLRLIDG